LLATKVLRTVVGGKTVYEAKWAAGTRGNASFCGQSERVISSQTASNDSPALCV